MRIVFVTDSPPSRLRPRPLGFVTELARRHDVTVVCLCHSPKDITDVSSLRNAGLHVTPVFEEVSSAAARAATALLGERSPQVAYYDSPKLRTAVMDEVARGGVGVVHVDRLRAAGSLASLPVPTVWDADECVSLLSRLRGERGARRVPGLPRRPGGQETQRLRAHERRLLGSFRHVVVSTDGDRVALQGAEQAIPEDDLGDENPDGTLTLRSLAPRAPSSIRVVPSGVDVDYFDCAPRRRHRDRLVFTGNFASHANVTAAHALIREVMPRIWATRPEIRVTIAGMEPPRHISAYARDERVTVLAEAPDLRPYIAGAYVAVSPMLYGTGVRNGVLEAMAMGTPVVASESATSGLSAVPGRDLLVASNADRFAQLVLRLLDDESLWRSLSRSGRASVERQHTWAHVTGKLEALYHEVSGYNFTLASAGVPVTARLTARVATPAE